jgi:hypothetical protein
MIAEHMHGAEKSESEETHNETGKENRFGKKRRNGTGEQMELWEGTPGGYVPLIGAMVQKVS